LVKKVRQTKHERESFSGGEERVEKVEKGVENAPKNGRSDCGGYPPRETREKH